MNKTNSNDIMLFLYSCISLTIFTFFAFVLRDEKEILYGLGVLSILFGTIAICSTIYKCLIKKEISSILFIATALSSISIISIVLLIFKL